MQKSYTLVQQTQLSHRKSKFNAGNTEVKDWFSKAMSKPYKFGAIGQRAKINVNLYFLDEFSNLVTSKSMKAMTELDNVNLRPTKVGRF